MNLLVLGGTLFLGRHVVTAAMACGHEVTTFTRGVTPASPIPGVRALHGDRNQSLDALRHGRWDAVIDTSGYLPPQARSAARALRDRVERYCFISTGSVYARHPPGGATENTATHAHDDAASSYGSLKASCEREIIEAFGDDALIVRPGVLAGPFDPTGRLSYWVSRIAEGGEVLAPGDPNHALQLLDARDLATWLLRALEADLGGVYNASGPDVALTMGSLLAACTAVTSSKARLAWAPDDFLLGAGVTPWADLPLWLPRDVPGPLLDSRKAVACALARRPVAETIHDVWRDDHRYVTVENGPPRPPAMTRARERELLRLLQDSHSGDR